MARGRRRVDKYFRLDPVKIKRAQKVLRAGTETEAIERALDLVISEHVRNRLAAEADDQELILVASGKLRLPKARLDVEKLLKIPTGRVRGSKAIQAVLADREEER